LNLKGEVVGINTVKVASAEGIGFAVPINVAIPIINKFATTGEFIEPYLGFLHMTKTLFLTLTEMSKCKTGLCGKCGRKRTGLQEWNTGGLHHDSD